MMKTIGRLASGVYVILLIAFSACQSQTVPPTPTAVPPIPTAQPASLIGRPIKDNRHPGVYLFSSDGHVRLIGGLPVFSALMFQFQDIITVPEDQLRAYPSSMPLTRWLTGTQDHSLYFIERGQRYRADAPMLSATGGSEFDVSLVPDSLLTSYPLSTENTLPDLVGIYHIANAMQIPSTQASLWVNDALWIARTGKSGGLTRWNPTTAEIKQFEEPGPVEALAAVDQNIFAATSDKMLWSFDGNVWTKSQAAGRVRAMTALQSALWYADANYYDTAASQYHVGRGLIRRDLMGNEQVFTLDVTENDPLRNITALTVQADKLWIGTRFSGLLQFDPAQQVWKRYNTLNSTIADNRIRDVYPVADGSLWIATDGGISRLVDGKFETHPLPDDRIDQQPLKLITTSDGNLWTVGDSLIARFQDNKTWQVYTPFTQPYFLDQWHNALVDNHGNLWVIGDQRYMRWDGNAWAAYDAATYKAIPLQDAKLSDFSLPAPGSDYQAWLQAWPRPVQDNGYGLHYLVSATSEPFELYQQIARLQRLKMHWVVVNYARRSQLFTMAPVFAKAGLMVIWRPFVRPYVDYPYWAEDVKFLRGLGIPPYLQIYNEPSLGQEWEDTGKSVDQAVYLDHLLPAMKQVYDAGGFVGLQELQPSWLRAVLDRMKAQNMTNIWGRLFFIAHSYGYNYPPEYDKNLDSVLGFRQFADVFQSQIGFVPMMIAGEGGWRPGEMQDKRYPMVTQTLHRDYLLSVYGWFNSGQLSNGEKLPDYLFAFCPWILSDPNDPAAWFDSTSGNRRLVIQALESLPSFTRRFSWDTH